MASYPLSGQDPVLSGLHIYKDNLFTNEKNCNIDVTEFKESYLLGAAMLPLEEFLN